MFSATGCLERVGRSVLQGSGIIVGCLTTS